MSGSQPPGWYPVPGSPAVQRWWDGIRWTGEVRDVDNPDGGKPLAAKFADGPAMTGLGSIPARPAPEQAKEAAAPSRGAPPEERGEPDWRAPAVEAWQVRTTPAPPRRLTRWLGRPRRG